MQTHLDKLEKATKSVTTAATEAKQTAERTERNAAASLARATASGTIAGEVFVVLGGFNRDSTAEVTMPAARAFLAKSPTACRLLPGGSVRYCPGWLLASSVTLAAPDLDTARRIISELRTAWGDTHVKTDNFEGRMYATLQKTTKERRHNRRLIAMAKVLQAAAMPLQPFAKVPAYTLVCWRTSTVVINAKRVVKLLREGEDGAIFMCTDWHTDETFGETRTKIEADLRDAALTA